MAAGTRRTPKKGDWTESFLKELDDLGAIAPAAKAVKIARSAVYRRREEDPEFAEALAHAMGSCVEEVETTLYQRARSGKDTTATIFFLKTRKPEVYGDKLRHEEREKIRQDAREEVIAEMQERLRSLPPAQRKAIMASTG